MLSFFFLWAQRARQVVPAALGWLLLVSVVGRAPVARAEVAPVDAALPVQRIEITGARRTRHETLRELLPHQPPGAYTPAALAEFERRIANLEIFDFVEVRRDDAVLKVRVREKWTLIPEIEFSTGSTLADTYALLGVTENNLFGRANALGVNIYRERRGFGFTARYEEHVYRRRRWARSMEAAYGSTELRFRDGSGWYTTSPVLCAWVTSPPVRLDQLRYEVGAIYKHERVDDRTGPSHAPTGSYAALLMTFTWDDYTWHDLAPHGFRAYLNLTPGVFIGGDVMQSRHLVELNLHAAVRLTRYTALMGRFASSLVTRGNANHAVNLGSVEGVRGIEDGWYYNWLQGVLNVELRQAIPLAARWALQGVLFADVGGFERVDARGGRAEADVAFSGGGGVRLVPTWLSGLLLRLDLARLVAPDRTFMYQFGLTQYF